jgi:tetratricopeptide (TPR) repeat protein
MFPGVDRNVQRWFFSVFHRVFVAAALLAGCVLAGCHSTDQIMFADGVHQLQRLAFADAESTFTRYVSLWPDATDGYYNRGLARAGQDRFADAMADFDRVVRISPGDRDARWMRFGIRESYIEVLADSAGLSVLERPLLSTLISALTILQLEELSSLIKHDPNDIAARCERGILLRKAGKLEEARADLTTTLLNAPWDVQARTERGNLFLEVGDNDAALADYDAALSACDTCRWLLYNKALALKSAGRAHEAVQALEALVLADSLDGSAWFMLGECRMVLGHRDRAIRAFARSADLGLREGGERLNELSR